MLSGGAIDVSISVTPVGVWTAPGAKSMLAATPLASRLATAVTNPDPGPFVHEPWQEATQADVIAVAGNRDGHDDISQSTRSARAQWHSDQVAMA
jgi:hypothetical protein